MTCSRPDFVLREAAPKAAGFTRIIEARTRGRPGIKKPFTVRLLASPTNEPRPPQAARSCPPRLALVFLQKPARRRRPKNRARHAAGRMLYNGRPGIDRSRPSKTTLKPVAPYRDAPLPLASLATARRTPMVRRCRQRHGPKPTGPPSLHAPAGVDTRPPNQRGPLHQGRAEAAQTRASFTPRDEQDAPLNPSHPSGMLRCRATARRTPMVRRCRQKPPTKGKGAYALTPSVAGGLA